MESIKKFSRIVPFSILNGLIWGTNVGLSFFIGIYLNSIGFTGAQIGILFAISTISSILTILPSGFSNDLFKSKHLIITSLILMGLKFFGIALTHNFYTMMLFFFLGGIGKSIYMTSAESLFYKTAGKTEFVSKIAIFQGIEHFLLAAGILVSGFLLGMNFDFESIFFYVGIIYLILSLVSIYILPLNLTSKFEFIHYKADFLRPKVLLFLVIVFLFALHYGAEETTYGLFLNKTQQLDKTGTGIYMGTAILIMSLTAFVIAKIFKKIKPRHLLLTGFFLSGTFHILMTVENIYLSFVFRVIHEIGDATWFIFLFYGIGKLFDLKRVGGNAGIFTLFTTFGTTVGALVSGPIGEKYGYEWPMILTGLSTLTAFILALIFIKHFDHE